MTFRLAALSAVLLAIPLDAGENPAPPTNVVHRGSLGNSLARFRDDRIGHVAFLGGSITEMNGYRPMIAEWLTKRFPETKFTFTNAGIASTCSTTGAFRLERDVLATRDGVEKGGVDLLFVEYAVNDDQDAGHARREAMRGMEGILRHVRREHPRADVIVTHFVNPGMLALLRDGRTPVSIAAHDSVTEHYGVPTVALAREVARRVDDGSLTWAVYGGTHPKPAGNRIAADMNIGLLEHAWADAPDPRPHELPMPLDARAYDRGRLVAGNEAELGDDWTFGVPPWKSIPGSLRSRFANRPFLHGTSPGAVAKLAFEGRGVGAYILAGPDAGIVEYRVDGGEWSTLDTYHRFSKGLHYPRTVMFAANLAAGEHELELRLAEKSNPDSKGTALRIVGFAVND